MTRSGGTYTIKGLVATLQATQSDVEPFLAAHTEDTIVVNFGGRRVQGRPHLRDAMEAGLATPLAQVTTTVEIDDIRCLTYVAVEEGGAWRIALAQTTPIAGS